MAHLLLADDDLELSDMLQEYLTNEGYTVDVAHDGEMALQKLQAHQYKLLILDIMMPKINGFDVLRQLRTSSNLPVLMLTARDEDVDSIIGLELGADDYLAKPCNPRVLVARIRAILRRSHTQEINQDNTGNELIKLDDIELHTGTRDVICSGKAIAMTSTEYSVLECLVLEAGHVISKGDLSQCALGRELTRYDRSLDMHISNLRKKLGLLASGQERIITVRGVGYLYARH